MSQNNCTRYTVTQFYRTTCMTAQRALGSRISLSCFSLQFRCSKVICILLPQAVYSTKLLCYHYLLPNIFLKKMFLNHKFKEKIVGYISLMSFIMCMALTLGNSRNRNPGHLEQQYNPKLQNLTAQVQILVILISSVI